MAASGTLSLMNNAISQLTMEETRNLVFKMGVPLKDVDNITERYSGDMQKPHLLQKWLDMNPDASWDKLVAGLRKINKNALATEVESKWALDPSSTTASFASSSSVSLSAQLAYNTPRIQEILTTPLLTTATLSATPVPVNSLPPAALTAPVGSLPPAALTAPVGSLPPAVLTAPVGSLPLAALTAPVSSLPPGAPTATPVPFGSLPPAPQTAATPASVGSLPPAPLTATPAPVGPLPHTATPASVGSLPPAPLTATPASVGSLPPALLTATPALVGPLPPAATPHAASVGSLPPIALTAPVGSLPPAPLTATPALVGSLPPAPPTATPAPVGSLPPAALTATPSPVSPLIPLISNLPLQTQSFKERVAATKCSIEKLQEDFSDLKSDAQEFLSEKENLDPKFVCKFRDHLLDLPVTKKQVHIQFFSRNCDKILKAETIQKIFIILGCYCNYSNYEIIFHIVNRFCPTLKGRTEKYRDSLTSFDKSTTIDVYLCAISARRGGAIREGFIRMTTKLKKAPSDSVLYEIRELKESIEEKASLESYAMYIETPEEGSVRVVLQVHEEVCFMVGAVFTLSFKQEYLLEDFTIGGKDLRKYPVM